MGTPFGGRISHGFSSKLRWYLSPFELLSQNITDAVAHKQQIFISHSSGGWRHKTERPRGQVQVRTLFWVADG